jgi:Fe-S-cluster-containing dehydrogenase component
VTVCPTGASYKRAEDGIVLVNPDTCIGCKLCSWACPTARASTTTATA